ncbi:MAG: retropepsin-like aspartic protease [Rhodocyclaceae bacterium]
MMPTISLLTTLSLTLAATFWSSLAVGKDCDGRHFAASDQQNRTPLRQPAPEFLESLDKAKAGDAAEQRNLAVRYESGYMVSRCTEEAARWYAKAAAGGDERARKWMTRQQSFQALNSGAECAGAGCTGSGVEETRVAVLRASPHRGRHYFAPVTINGRTVEGMIDTGASMLAMSTETAKAFGIKYTTGTQGMASTANGKISTYRIVVPLVEVAGIKARNVAVSVGITGELLVGMSFLSQLDVAITADTMTMRKR